MVRRWLVLALAFGSTAKAQDGPLLHPQEALAVHRLLGLSQAFGHSGPLDPRRAALPRGIGSRAAAQLRRRQRAVAADPDGPGALDGYHFAYFNEGRNGAPVPYTQSAIRARGGFCAYAWPQAHGQRVFFLSSKGVLLALDGTDGYHGLTAPEGGAALARGEDTVVAAALDTPGRGQDGQLWGPIDRRWFGKLELLVADEMGMPLCGFTVQVVTHDPAQRPKTIALGKEPVPLANGEPGRDGRCLLWGPKVSNARLGLSIGARVLRLTGATVHRDRSALRLVLPWQGLRNQVIISNESAAMATLKNISSSQAQCQAMAAIDANGNGAGEYGFFAELSGVQPVRSDGKGSVGKKHIHPPVLSGAFGKVRQGRIVRYGYVFQMFLPDSDGQPLAEAAGGGGRGQKVDPAMAEVIWCAYAWPLAAGKTGKRAFFVNQAGDVFATGNDDGAYSGHEDPVEPMAGFRQGAEEGMAGPAAANGIGQDGNRWRVIG